MRGVGVMKKDKMKYLAHIDGKREQSIKEHLEGTAVLAASLQSPSERNSGVIVLGCCMI